MHQRTIATLKQLEDTTWFSQVGVQDAHNALILGSWMEALAHSTNLNWKNLRLQMGNNLSSRILKVSKERFRKWNEIVLELKQVTIPLVKERIESVVRENNLPKAFENAVQWDILHLCMESEYADICPPGFYAGLAYWYVKGHFPCGWDYNVLPLLPKGRPIVY
jgi:hypothetical protein